MDFDLMIAKFVYVNYNHRIYNHGIKLSSFPVSDNMTKHAIDFQIKNLARIKGGDNT